MKGEPMANVTKEKLDRLYELVRRLPISCLARARAVDFGLTLFTCNHLISC